MHLDRVDLLGGRAGRRGRVLVTGGPRQRVLDVPARVLPERVPDPGPVLGPFRVGRGVDRRRGPGGRATPRQNAGPGAAGRPFAAGRRRRPSRRDDRAGSARLPGDRDPVPGVGPNVPRGETMEVIAGNGVANVFFFVFFLAKGDTNVCYWTINI